jgi:type I restriction enzyme S subunit
MRRWRLKPNNQMKLEDNLLELPTGWSITNIGNVTEVIMGQSPPSDTYNYEKNGLPFFQGKAEFTDLHPIIKKWCSEPNKIALPDDILVSVRAPVGAVNIANVECCIGRGLSAIRYSECNKFLYYFFKFIEKKLDEKGTGTTFRAISGEVLKDFPLQIPPLNEQHRIVAKIETLFSELDKGIESFKTAREQLKIYRQALLKHAFSGKLTEQWRKNNAINGDWREAKLGSLLDFLTSGSRGWAQYYSKCGDIFIRAQNLKYDYLDLSEKAYVSLPEHTEGLRTRVQIGDLLITITGANVTKSALVEHDLGVAYVSQHVALCRPTREILPKYLYWFVVAEADGRKQLSDAAYGAGKPGLNLENIRSVVIDVPCLLEQKAIVELIEEKLSVVDQLDQTITTALQQAEALRQSILKKAFSGQLVPQDANDEPASVLLERIRAEKAQADIQPARRRGKTA